MTNMENFFQHVSGDEALQQELNQAIGGKEGEEALQAIVDLAQAHGFNLSMAETAAAVSSIAQRLQEERELADEELEGVTGGFIGYALWAIGLKWNGQGPPWES